MVARVDAVELYGAVDGPGAIPGASSPRIMKCSDSQFYVVKRPNNRHGRRSLANELLASLLLRRLGITTPEPAIVNCSLEFLNSVGFSQPQDSKFPNSKLLEDETQVSGNCWGEGLAFGSRIDPAGWQEARLCPVTWHLPLEMLPSVKNLFEFIDVAVFDQWVCNMDGRQVAFVRPKRFDGFIAQMVDHGMCFGGRDWKLSRIIREPLFTERIVYDSVYGLDAFEDAITKIRSRCSFRSMYELASQIPSEWYFDEHKELKRLLKQLVTRQKHLEALLCKLNQIRPSPFRNWNYNWRMHPQNTFSPACFVRVGRS